MSGIQRRPMPQPPFLFPNANFGEMDVVECSGASTLTVCRPRVFLVPSRVLFALVDSGKKAWPARRSRVRGTTPSNESGEPVAQASWMHG